MTMILPVHLSATRRWATRERASVKQKQASPWVTLRDDFDVILSEHNAKRKRKKQARPRRRAARASSRTWYYVVGLHTYVPRYIAT